jgi:hypothetical protein
MAQPQKEHRSMQSIPVEDAKLIAEARGYDQVVIMARKPGENGGEHVTTYGTDATHSAIAAAMGDKLKQIMEWPSGSWHATAELVAGEIELTLWETTDPGPLREWKPARAFPIDEAHATELLGTLALALEKKRQLATEPPG